MQDHEKQSKANIILIAGLLFNLTIGVLYAWSVIKKKLIADIDLGGWGWTSTEAGLPYTVAIGCFSIGLLVGGKIQDKIGPRWVVTTGGAFVGLGLFFAGFLGGADNVPAVVMSFGILTGLGLGLGYGCVSPPAYKWFHPSKKGIVSGLIVGGFGIAALIYSPLATYLLNSVGIAQTFMTLGAGVFIISTLLAQLIKNPPPGYVPPQPVGAAAQAAAAAAATPVDMTSGEVMRTKRFWLMFVVFLISASIGLMIIGNITKIAEIQIVGLGPAIFAILVSFLAITNTFGRVLGGLMSDKIGRVNALFVVTMLQMLNMVGFYFYQSIPALCVGIVLVGFCYGTLLSVFPALTADLFGLTNLGSNYGILFLAWGLSGVGAPLMADYIYDTTGAFTTAYIICACMLVVAAFANFLLKKDVDALLK